MQAVTDRSPHSSSRADAGAAACVAVLGEIHTGLLQSSTAVTSDVARELLALIPRTPVRTWERPIRHAASPERLTGIDSNLPSESGTLTRAVGTVGTEARITGGHVLQVSSRTAVVTAEERRRLPWSHYLSRPGTVEAWGTPRLDDLVGGFLRIDPASSILDLGGVSAYFMGEIQRSPLVDRKPPFRVSRTRLRWAAVPATDATAVTTTPTETDTDGSMAARITFLIETPALRTVRVTDADPRLIERLPELCQDIALHDWLLSSVASIVDVAHIGGRTRSAVLDHLRPAVDHLLHAWMPAARLTDDLRTFWDEVERRAGLERQWDSVVRRIRDQVALASAALVSSATATAMTIDAANPANPAGSGGGTAIDPPGDRPDRRPDHRLSGRRRLIRRRRR